MFEVAVLTIMLVHNTLGFSEGVGFNFAPTDALLMFYHL